MDQALGRLEANGFTVNPLKCEWAIEETNFLGCKLAPEGAKPWSECVEPTLAMKWPTTMKELRRFIGTVNFH